MDRGSLRYTIRLRDEFRGTFSRFRREIDDSRRALDRLSRAGATVRLPRQQATQQRQFTRQQNDRLRQIAAEAQARERQARELGRLARQQRQDEARVRRQLVQAGREQVRQGQREARIAERRIASLRGAVRETDRLRASTRAVNREGGRLLFTFRRLFGALAAFALAREAASSFRDLVRLGIQFNAELEQGRLGFAGLLTAAGEVRDTQGRLLRGQQAFNVALQAAGQLQLQLRQRALETTATAQELAFAFQQAIAPGLARGLDPDQILDLTVGISQAASAIGLAQNQLAEEVRSILSGTARAQTTRLAALFGGAQELNRLVRQAETADDLFQIITERLEGTSAAARIAATTVPGLFARIRDALALVAGTAALQFFGELREILGEIFNTLVIVNEATGRLEPNPEILPAFEAIFDAVSNISAAIVEFARNVGLGGLTTAAEILGTVLEVVASAFLGAADAIRLVTQLVGAALGPFIELIGGAQDLGVALGEVSRIIGTVLTTLALVRTATFLWGAAMRIVGVNAAATAVSVDAAAAATGRARLAALGLVAAVAGIVFGFQQVFEAITGVEVSLGNTLRIIGLSFRTAFETVTRQLEITFKEFANVLVGIFTDPIGTIANLFNNLILRPFLGAAAALAAIGVITEETRIGIEDASASIEAALGRIGENQPKIFNTERDKLDLLQFLLDTRQAFTDLRAEIAAEGVTGPGFDESFNELERRIQELQGRITGRGSGDEDPSVSAAEAARLSAAQRQLELTQVQVAAQRELFRLGQQGATSAQISVQEERNKLAILESQRNLRAREVQEQGAALFLQLDQTSDLERRQFLQDQINTLTGQGVAENQLANLEIAAQNEKLREQQLIAEGTIDQGFARGLRNFAEQFGSAFEAGIRIAEGILNRFSSFVSQSIVDALDPTKDFDLRERFARFLQDIAQLIIQQLVQLAIAKAILGFGGPGGIAGAGGRIGVPSAPSFLNLAEGGQVPGGPAFESRPPPGAPRSDTVAARLTPGEHVSPLRTVARLGADFFERLRAGAGNPMELRSMVGLGAARRARRASAKGYFQAGGLVGNQVRRAEQTIQSTTPTPSGPGGMQRAFVVQSESEMDKLIRGGEPAIRRFVLSLAPEIQAAAQ